jgi:hypothetical protein
VKVRRGVLRTTRAWLPDTPETDPDLLAPLVRKERPDVLQGPPAPTSGVTKRGDVGRVNLRLRRTLEDTWRFGVFGVLAKAIITKILSC